MDFTAMVREIQARGGFKEYEQPLASQIVAEDIGPRVQNPHFPGERAFPSDQGVDYIEHHNVPQALIDANRDAIRDTFRFYMPPHAIDMFAREFVQTDFLQNPSFESEVADSRFPSHFRDSNYLPDELTGDWKSNERNHKPDRVLYTKEEMRITKDVCEARPEIALTVLAFQRSFVEYAENLRNAIEAADFLSPEEKARGLHALTSNFGLISQFSNSRNFTEKFLPSIAVHYAQNHKGDFSEEPTMQDFVEGVTLPYTKRMFFYDATGPDGEVKRFSCLAASTIIHVAGVNADETEEKVHDGNKIPEEANIGHFLYAIHQSCEKQLADEALKVRLVSVLQRQIDLCTSPEQEAEALKFKASAAEAEKIHKNTPPQHKVCLLSAANSPLDAKLTDDLDVYFAVMKRCSGVAVDKIPVSATNTSEVIKRMGEGDIILLGISPEFISVGGEIIQEARRLQDSEGKRVNSVAYRDMEGIDTRETLAGIGAVPLHEPLYTGAPFNPKLPWEGEIFNDEQGYHTSVFLGNIVKEREGKLPVSAQEEHTPNNSPTPRGQSSGSYSAEHHHNNLGRFKRWAESIDRTSPLPEAEDHTPKSGLNTQRPGKSGRGFP